MTLQTSGPINFSQIGVEAKQPLLSTVSLNNLELRKLVNKTVDKSQISAQDFYGKQYGVGPGYALADFAAVQDAVPGNTYVSNIIYAVEDSSVAIFCDYPAWYSINGGSWTDKSVLGAITVGQTIQIKVTAASTYSTHCPVSVRLGPTTKEYSVTTGAEQILYLPIYMRSDITYYLNAYGHRDRPSGVSAIISVGGLMTVKHTADLGFADLDSFNVDIPNTAGNGEYSASTESRVRIESYCFLKIRCLAGESMSLVATSASDSGPGSSGIFKTTPINATLNGKYYTSLQIMANSDMSNTGGVNWAVCSYSYRFIP